MGRFLKTFLVILAVLIGLAPVAIAITLYMMPLWLWIELNYQIESVGHSGPSGWCYVAIYALLVAVSFATLSLLALTGRKKGGDE